MAPNGSQTNQCRIATFFTLLVTFLILFLVASQTRAFAAIYQLNNSSPPNTDQNDKERWSNAIPYTFRERQLLEDLSVSNDDTWRAMTAPPKGGFIKVRYNETNSIPYGISMFHALHCLQLLRQVVQTAPGFEHAAAGSHNASQSTEPHHLHGDKTHVTHCIGYIAQNIMCAADATIEPPRLSWDNHGDVSHFAVDGQGFAHTCRDASVLWSIAAKSGNEWVDPWDWKQGDTVHSVFNV